MSRVHIIEVQVEAQYTVHWRKNLGGGGRAIVPSLKTRGGLPPGFQAAMQARGWGSPSGLL